MPTSLPTRRHSKSRPHRRQRPSPHCRRRPPPRQILSTRLRPHRQLKRKLRSPKTCRQRRRSPHRRPVPVSSRNRLAASCRRPFGSASKSPAGCRNPRVPWRQRSARRSASRAWCTRRRRKRPRRRRARRPVARRDLVRPAALGRVCLDSHGRNIRLLRGRRHPECWADPGPCRRSPSARNSRSRRGPVCLASRASGRHSATNRVPRWVSIGPVNGRYRRDASGHPRQPCRRRLPRLRRSRERSRSPRA